MLALNSPQWKSFDTYSGLAEELPDNLRAWQAAVNTFDEEGAWGWLRDQFLCQATIKDAAIAIVPHICSLLPTTPTTLRHYYAIDLGQVHMAWRLNPMASVSADLVASYESSIASIRPWACDCLTRPLGPMDFRYLVSACCALCDHAPLGRFLFTIDGLADDFPDLAGYR